MPLDKLGKIHGEFKPGVSNLVAGFIISLLLLGVGCVIPYFCIRAVIDHRGQLPMMTGKGERGWSWGAIGLAGALSLGLLIGAASLLRWLANLLTFRLYVGEHGLALTDSRSARFVAWEEIREVEETHLYERPPLLKGIAKYLLPVFKSQSFEVHLFLGESVAFNGTTIKGHVRLAELIQQETDRRHIPWHIVEQHAD